MSLEIPANVAVWIAKRPDGPRWNIQYLRCGCSRHVAQFHAYAVDRLFNRALPWTVLRQVSMLARFSRQLGERSFLEIDAKDIEAVLDAPSYPKYRNLSLELSKGVIANNADQQANHLMALRLFLTFLYTEEGMTPEKAKEEAHDLVASAKPKSMEGSRRRPQLRLTAEDIAAIYRAIAGLCLTQREAVQATLWVCLLVAHGPRAAGCLRSKVGNVTWTGGKGCIAVPPGFRHKKTVPLFLDETTGKLMQAYLATHPARGDGTAPLFIDAGQAEAGRTEPLTTVALQGFLERLGRKAGLKQRLGIRSFRKFMATRTAVEGGDMADLRRRLGHTSRSFVTNRYIQLTRSEVLEVVRALRSGQVGSFSPCCGFRFRPGDTVCAHCGKRVGGHGVAGTPLDAEQARRNAAGELGLDCISDLEAAVGAQG